MVILLFNNWERFFMKKKSLLLGALMLIAMCASACTPTSSNGNSSSSSVSSHNSTTSSVTSSSKSSSSSSSSSKSSSSTSSSTSSSSSSSSSSSNSSSSSSSSTSSSVSSSSSSSSSSSQRPQNVSLDIFAFNDTHGNVVDTEGKGISLAKTATLLKELRNENSIFISQGDMWQGSVESGLTRGNIVTEWMNSLDFVSMTVGNHEFDWGSQYIASNQELANFPTLGINVLNRNNNQRVNYLSPSVTFTRGGAKIGVIGAIGNCYSSISRSKVSDIYFATGSALTSLVKQEANRLKNDEKCDFIIYSIHGSNVDGDYDSELSNGYVDLVLEGHTHNKYAETDEYGVYHVQSNAYNESFYRITVDLDLTNKTCNVNEPVSYNTLNSSSPYRNYAEDAETKTILAKYKDKYEFAYEVSGYNETTRYANELKQKVADLYYETGNTTWGNQYNLILGGGYISCRGSSLQMGDVTYADLFNLFPFDNDVSLCSISGRNLRNTQFITGNSNYYINWSSYGESIRDNIDDYATYYLITDTYTVDYYTSLNVIATYENGGTYARDLLDRYIRNDGFGTKPIQQGHEGTANDPRTVAEALEYAYTHPGSSASNAGSLAMYYKGVVSRQAAYVSGQGDMSKVYIKDEGTDNEIMIYYLKKTQNNSGSTWTDVNELQLGDELIVCGRAFYYNSNTPELDNSTWVYSINGVRTA